MLPQTIQVELPGTWLERVRIEAVDDVRDLITFLLEEYVQDLEKAQRWQAYEAYYASRTLKDESEELALLVDFAFADTEVSGEMES